MKYTEYIDELPPIYQSWLEFYAAIKTSLRDNTREIEYRMPRGPEIEDITVYKCSIQVIKAKCFDEMIEAWSNHRDSFDHYEVFSGGVEYYNEQFSRRIFMSPTDYYSKQTNI